MADEMMMMAHDSGFGSGDLSEEAIDSVRSALVSYVDAPSRGERLHETLNTLAAEARARRILPEHLLVVLKDIWYSLPSVREISDPSEQVRLLQRVVTMCIKAYYAD